MAQVSGRKVKNKTKQKNRAAVRCVSIIGKEIEKAEGGERFVDEEQDSRV